MGKILISIKNVLHVLMWHSRATNLTILVSPLNMQGMPGALQVLAALLHGVQTIHTNDTRQLTVYGSLDLTAIQVRKATAAFHKALSPHELWVGSLPVCLEPLSRTSCKLKHLACRTGPTSLDVRLRTGSSGRFPNTRMAGHPRRATVRMLETTAQQHGSRPKVQRRMLQAIPAKI